MDVGHSKDNAIGHGSNPAVEYNPSIVSGVYLRKIENKLKAKTFFVFFFVKEKENTEHVISE